MRKLTIFGRSRPRGSTSPAAAVAELSAADGDRRMALGAVPNDSRLARNTSSTRLLRLFGVTRPRGLSASPAPLGLQQPAAVARKRTGLLIPPEAVYGRPVLGRPPSFRAVDRSAATRVRALLPLVPAALAQPRPVRARLAGEDIAALATSQLRRDVSYKAIEISTQAARVRGGASPAAAPAAMHRDESAAPSSTLANDSSYRAVDLTSQQRPRGGDQAAPLALVHSGSAHGWLGFLWPLRAAGTQSATSASDEAASAVPSSAAGVLRKPASFGQLGFAFGRPLSRAAVAAAIPGAPLAGTHAAALPGNVAAPPLRDGRDGQQAIGIIPDAAVAPVASASAQLLRRTEDERVVQSLAFASTQARTALLRPTLRTAAATSQVVGGTSAATTTHKKKKARVKKNKAHVAASLTTPSDGRNASSAAASSVTPQASAVALSIGSPPAAVLPKSTSAFELVVDGSEPPSPLPSAGDGPPAALSVASPLAHVLEASVNGQYAESPPQPWRLSSRRKSASLRSIFGGSSS